MKNNPRGLGGALASLERRIAAGRICAAIENARRRSMTCGQPNFLKSYQVELALELIGKGQTVPSIAQKLHCGPATLYRAIAALPTRRFYS